MFTKEQYDYLRDYLDLRKKEIQDISLTLEEFPFEVDFDKLDWELVKETWEICDYEYLINQIICDQFLDHLIRDTLIDITEDYCIYWSISEQEIVITDIQPKEGISQELISEKIKEFFITQYRIEWA